MVPATPLPTARFWRSLEGGAVACGLCPRRCRLREGQRGYCLMRGNEGGAMVLHGHGRSSGFAVDPIEKKPLHHFRPGLAVLSFGTLGCNLGCRFCQNWDLSRAPAGRDLAGAVPPAAVPRMALDRGCGGVAFTYNDPVVFHEYAVETAQACRERGLATVAVTAGYHNPEPREEFYRHMDAANIDLKGISDAFYRTHCAGRLGPVLDTLKYVRHGTRTWLEVTTLLIPGANDAPADLDALSAWIAGNLGPDVPLHFTAFRPAWKLKALPPTPLATLLEARRLALANGLRHVYLGNVRTLEGSGTVCHGCGHLLIGRDGYRLTRWDLTREGACARCGTPCPGVFGPGPG
ncbi:AmmeMemoRadiSam system radical SAM enzyme [Mesoterricola silvestris]|uniref:AmmeMemoRadiSam system radical SAM enzyme n=1 Tax=Mesoterricola silvestris TaxID=2927979 RepID=A0AA48GIY6_9BACT|nr:AmmeMemoRadiSam system radical SAM enzyme [Mesoterricola silvestris]BDU71934.1 AmmeMemoRadiSam system radical SAM enzyme [Mesoterricola silvestris]